MNLADQRGRGDANAPGHLEQVYTLYKYTNKRQNIRKYSDEYG